MSSIKTSEGVILADDQYDYFRCQNATKNPCSVCEAKAGFYCRPISSEHIYDVKELFVHMARETYQEIKGG